eukprot:Gb_05737 [translate_table: standard]
MEFTRPSIHILVACSLVMLLSNGLALASGNDGPYAPAMFVFGDSVADGGNNNYIHNTSARANFPPYGETFFHRPTGRFTNGRTAFDFIAARLKLPFPPPFLEPGADFSNGINFASGGSGILDSTGKGLNIIPLGLQIQQYKNISSFLLRKQGLKSGNFSLSKCIYAINIGANDIGLNYLQNDTFRNTTTPEGFVKLLLTQYKKYLLSLYSSGARNFIVLDIPPLGCTPNWRLAGFQTRNGMCFEAANQLGMEFNAGLRQLVNSLNQNLKGATFLSTNSYQFVLYMILRGKSYGFSETRSACCGAGPFNTAVGCGKEIPKKKHGEYKAFLCKKPSSYLFWDGTHPSERAYRILYREIWGGNTSFIFPFNLKTLIQKQDLNPNITKY